MLQRHRIDGSTVFVIGNDGSDLTLLTALFDSVGLNVQVLSSATAFLEQPIPNAPCCLLLEVRLPGMSGLKFQEELAQTEVYTPIVFLTAYGDIPMSVRAMKAGAIDFLTKPFRSQDILDAVFAGLERDRARREKEQASASLRERFNTLSARQRSVVIGVAAGNLNKQIAGELGLSEVTVKLHRARAMRKLRAKSFTDLVRMIDLIIPSAEAKRLSFSGSPLM